MPITLDSRHDITLDAARRVGWEGERIKIGAGAKATMKSARAGFERLMADPDIVIYGVTSGYGQNARVRLTPEQRKEHARQPLWHVQAHFGAAYPERVTRLMVLARLANFLGGHCRRPAAARRSGRRDAGEAAAQGALRRGDVRGRNPAAVVPVRWPRAASSRSRRRCWRSRTAPRSPPRLRPTG